MFETDPDESISPGSGHPSKRGADPPLPPETELIHLRRAYQYLYETELVGFFRTRIDDGKVLKANRAAARIMGFPSVESLLGSDHCASDFYSPRRREELLKALEEKGEVSDFETPYTRADGSQTHISISARAYPDAGYLEGVILDVSRRKRVEQALRDREERYSSILMHISDVVFLVDGQLQILYASPTSEKMLGHTPEELVGKNGLEFIHPDDHQTAFDAFAEVVREENPFQPTPLRFRHKSGHWVKIEVLGNNMLSRSSISGIVITVRDITERVRAEEERRRLEAQIQHAQKMESLGILAGGIAHDFNNLLMGILGNADLAIRDIHPASPAMECLRDIETSSRRAADLCRQMLAYSGKGKFVVESVDLTELVEEMTHLLDVSVAHRATVAYEFHRSLPTIKADATQLRQIVMNLITNAAEAVEGEKGHIFIRTGLEHGDRAYLDENHLGENLPEGDYAYLEVHDNGTGMEPEVQQYIFDPFFTTKFSGRGLGLSAVLGIVRGHGGAIRIYSEPGKGTTFKVLFPAERTNKAGKAAVAAPGGDGDDWTGAGTVLLVDDDVTVREMGKRLLSRLGFDVLVASDGFEAVDLFRECRDEVVCVLLDLTMPKMDGETCFRELRRIRRDVRVILSSGYNAQEITQRFAGKGLAGFIQKPYVLSTLREHVRHAMETDPRPDKDAEGAS